ncbi:MAG: hypothetical protein EYC70_16925 [Planctomycetota bacterium]|nr:MAG: hypothetical protein EYC70_16925 [Planctomycetota bacterium]
MTHEYFGYDLPARGGEPFVDALLDLAARSGMDAYGDVAFGYLYAVEHLLARCPSARLMCLQRDRAETVDSLWRWSGPRHHWTEHDGLEWQCDPWDHCFPKFGLADKRAAVERYWDSYYAAARAWEQARPDAVRVFPMDALNSESGQRAILDFAGYAPQDMRLHVGLRLNPLEKARHLTA